MKFLVVTGLYCRDMTSRSVRNEGVTVHTALVLGLFFALTPFATLHTIFIFHFRFTALWLAPFYYAKHLISDGNTIFDSGLLFQDHNQSVK